MTGWAKVKWTQAGQICRLMEVDASLIEDPDDDPESGYRKLRARNETSSAMTYIGHALPRFEAVAWAAHLLHEWSRALELGIAEQQALDSVQRWVEEPTEEYRRAAYEAGERAARHSPEQLLAWAVFMSGGSISEPDLPPVQPPQRVCGRLAASSILLAANRTQDPKAALEAACDAGERVATKGVEGLAAK